MTIRHPGNTDVEVLKLALKQPRIIKAGEKLVDLLMEDPMSEGVEEAWREYDEAWKEFERIHKP